MITVIQNKQGERAVVANMTAFRRIAAQGVDTIARRFLDATPVYHLPLDIRKAGANAGLRMLVDSLGAIYPEPNSRRLAIVGSTGEVLHGPNDKVHLARMTGTARRTIVTCLTHQRRLSRATGHVVHL
jgi:hypothetical protein